MQTLAKGVGDLKRGATQLKSRGILVNTIKGNPRKFIGPDTYVLKCTGRKWKSGARGICDQNAPVSQEEFLLQLILKFPRNLI